MAFKKQSRVSIQTDYRIVFGSEVGERVLQHICKVGCIDSPTRVKGDPVESAENEGMRRMALSILRYAKKDVVEQIEQEYTNAR